MENEERALDDATEGRYNELSNLMKQNKIKLWEEPYFSKDSGPQDDKLLELACNLSPTLEMDQMFVLGGLRHWQKNALGKLEAREKLKAGTVVLKLKIAKDLRPKDSKENIPTSVEVPSDATGAQLAEAVGKLVKVEAASLKLISGGKVLKEEGTVCGDLGLKPGNYVMVVRINRSDDQLKVLAEQKMILDDTRNDADLLATAGDLDIQDQSGKRLDIPLSERKALILAMSFHEKGRASLKKKRYDFALVLLLNAADEYSKLSDSDILMRADNYALLNLDIAWCYLKLGNLSQLPDAEQRLNECEIKFHKSYGTDMQRVVAIKGSADNERALYLRLHLLQGIVAFHQGHRGRAAQILLGVEANLRDLDVPDDALAEVVALGYTDKEARLALRAESGNVASAVKYAQNARAERQRIAEEEAVRAKKRREYGKTKSGNWVNLGYVSTLEKMGFHEMYAVAALRQTDNDLNASMDVIQEHPELLEATAQDVDDSPSSGTSSSNEDDDGGEEKDDRDGGDPRPGPSSGGGGKKKKKKRRARTEVTKEARKRRRDEREARDRLHDAIGDLDGDDHLDLALEEDRELLKQYKEYLAVRGFPSYEFI